MLHAIERSRPAAVAGSFYPAQPKELRAAVQGLLASAVDGGGPVPKALIAPHAGYVYSGAVAAAAFATLRAHADACRRVMVIGPAHYLPVEGIGVPSATQFVTPLGVVPVDEATMGLCELPFVHVADAAHAPEHALEVELPFLQSVLGRFTLVPVLVGDAAPEQVAEVLERSWDRTLIVVSSDLSHDLSYDAAQRCDGATAAAIERGDWAALGPGDACGHLAIAGLLQAAARRNMRAQRLALCNSGDSAGSRDRVVGYGAWAFGSGGGGFAPRRRGMNGHAS
jgi:AmmeMemoRadiSam system protein B